MEYPFISVVIPVFNNNDGLAQALEGIADQKYPKQQYEVIVVDNGSEVSPRLIVQSYGAYFLEENKNLNSPYSARNRGIEASKGAVIALLDATCKPSKNWLSEGVNEIVNGADMVGGNVVFDICEKSGSGEIYDSFININMKSSIEKRSVAKTTNLFFKREVLEEIGPFPEGLRSGGDVRWTYTAVSNGKKLVFCESAVVYMKPRGFRPLSSKQYRVSKGMPTIWKMQGTILQHTIKKVLLGWLPPNPARFRRQIKNSNLKLGVIKIFSIYMIAYSLRMVSVVGILVGYRDFLRSKVE